MRIWGRLPLALFSASLVASCGAPDPMLEGRIEGGTYISPGNLFRVDVPVMRNPFVKQPNLIRDARTSDGRVEVTFSVTDLGEAWRYGTLPLALDASTDASALAVISDRQLARWSPTPSPPNLVLQEEIRLADGPGLLRIYYQHGASLLFRRGDAASERDSAFVGVVAAVSAERQQVLYAVGQFDMPLHQLRFFVEDVQMPRERVLQRFATEHAARLRELTASFRLQ